MPEFIREVNLTLTLEVDTNKRTVTRTCTSVSEAAEVLRLMKRATSVADMLTLLETTNADSSR